MLPDPLGLDRPPVLVGVGGIGTPAAIGLLSAGVRRIVLVDDDCVDLSNLHRQILFTDADVGRPKLQAFAAALERRFPAVRIELRQGRALPHTALDLVRGAGVVIDATDNFASRFLLSDACFLARVPVVHAAAVRWTATVIACAPEGGPCYRCLFEDIPTGNLPDCATAGVVGPVCGVGGALAADRAFRILASDHRVYGNIATFDGLTDRLRKVAVRRRDDCSTCGRSPTLRDLDPSRYIPPSCQVPFL